jgi:DNA-3-methyladenine glycosylase I
MVSYHDAEWGVPIYDDKLLFAKLILDGAQAGLSWKTILRKRENYWQAFDNFDPHLIALYNDAKFAELMDNPGIVRNRLKIKSAIQNAKGYLKIQEEYSSFSRYLWDFVGGAPIINAWTSMSQLPATSPESEAMSADLKSRGLNFVGPTICYAFMQAVGMVNDHTVDCFRYFLLTNSG